MSPIHIGTAGWSLPSADRACCPGAGSHLARYAARLAATEINSSFYRPHRQSTYARWAATVPEWFSFAVKMPKAVTHDHRLIGCGPFLDRFVDEVRGLGPKLGVLLVQLPPSLPFDALVAARFFVDLRARIDAPVACEPRHASWFTPDAEALLASHNVARVAADPAPAAGAGEPGGWPGLAYWRLHGSPRMYYSDYDAAAIGRMAVALNASRDVPTWCVFDNTAAGHALGNALSLMHLVAGQASARSVRRRLSSASAAVKRTATAASPALR